MIYTGKEGKVVARDLRRKAVMSLIEPFLDKGYYVFMDNNFYTSVTLFEVLEERKALACGTDQAYQKKSVVCKKRKSNSLNGERVCTDKMEM